MKLFGTLEIVLVNIYAPNVDSPGFFRELEKHMTDMGEDLPFIIAGDWNLTLNEQIDRYNYRNINNPRARAEVLGIIERLNLVDIFRERHGNEARYTWRVRNPEIKQARLDFFLISPELSSITIQSDILPGYRTDHSMVTLHLNAMNQPRGKPLFKFNTSLLRDEKYRKLIKDTIIHNVQLYSVPVYDANYVRECVENSNCWSLEFMISDSLLFEAIILSCRTETITYSIRKSKESRRKQKELEDVILLLEHQQSVVPTEANGVQLEIKQQALEDLRRPYVDGLIIRSRANWYQNSEKSTHYFYQLERRNYINRLIPCLSRPSGEVVCGQKEILKYIAEHFTDTFGNHDTENDAENYLSSINLATLNESECEVMSKDITLDEINVALHSMKHNKSPGSDGFPAEFYKFFWSSLKCFVTRMFEESYSNAALPQSLREGIIILLPKNGRPRDQLKSYRPITLLNTAYKILSGVIANRFKQVISKLIHPAQTAFIKGRFIGDNIRIMSDVMHCLKHEKKDGLFISVDMEGAFNSVSWNFIKVALLKYGFPQQTVQWFRILYEKSTARVSYNGHLSEAIQLQRSCRQGDPLSCYLFLIVMECLGAKIRQNGGIKGIQINDLEIRTSMYADDMLCMLDGSVNSCRLLFNDLGTFAKYSGLRPNICKTEAMWIGHGVEGRLRICDEIDMKWVNEMKVLGIFFRNDEHEMIARNFDNKLLEIAAIIKSWRYRHLTVYGKVLIIKSLLVSKLVHLFTALPDPPESFIKQLNTALFRFLWNGKNDKISRKSATFPCYMGGVGMVDIKNMIAALKVTWVRRYICAQNLWAVLFDLKISDGSFVWDRNAASLRIFAANINNRFWKDVVESVALLRANFTINMNDITSCNLWFSDVTKYKENIEKAWEKRDLGA